MAGYGDDAGLTAWLASQGHTLPVGAPSSAVLRQRGADYVDGVYGPRFRGIPTAGISQERAWPRIGASAYNLAIADNVIPSAVINASFAAAYQEATSPGSLTATTSGTVKREKVGSLEVEYFEAGTDPLRDAAARRNAPLILAVESLLAPFLTTLETSTGPTIWSIG